MFGEEIGEFEPMMNIRWDSSEGVSLVRDEADSTRFEVRQNDNRSNEFGMFDKHLNIERNL